MTCLALCISCGAFAGEGTITIDTAKLGARVPKGLYGVFLEEINNAGEGGLYAEMIQNRGFEDANLPPACTLEGNLLATPKKPSFWEGYSKDWKMDWPYAGMGATPFWTIRGAEMRVVSSHPLTQASPHAVQIEAKPGASLVNDGFWGMNVEKGAGYDLSFFAQTKGFKGSLEARLIGSDGQVLASSKALVRNGGWRRIATTLTAKGSDPKAKIALVTQGSGQLLIDFVSLMPQKRWRGLPLRPDIADMIADLKPGFVRWPGGCVTEGITIETRPRWQQTLGPLEGRVPTFVPWGYWVSNGFGYHEWLLFCEELKAEPLYVFNAGISCAFRSGTFLSDAELPAEIESILNAIEYAVGPTTSKYGAMRAKAGHPKPFPMKMVEIGNEDQGAKYGERFKRISAAVKAKYPKMKVILSSWIAGIDHAAINAAGPQLDIVDEHAYTGAHWAVTHFDHFARYPRNVPWELYIGEFAANAGVGRGNMLATLNDATYMMSMEKNADLVKMGSYAPLLENVNRREWEVNLIHFDSRRIFGRASYYACKLFADNVPDANLTTTVSYDSTSPSTIQGPIGLGTYGTSAEFKDVHLEQDGKLISVPEVGWKPRNGSWTFKDGVYAQTSEDWDCWTFFGDSFHDVTLTAKARKLSGGEGFVVSVGDAEGRRVQFNVGGWGNRQHTLEASGLIRGTPGTVETGRWYDLKVTTKGREVWAFLDGKEILHETLPRIDKVLAIAGRDKNDVILKVLNPGAEPADIRIDIQGLVGFRGGSVTVLSSQNLDDENSFEQPRKIAPVTRKLDSLRQTFPPYSISIVRVSQ